MVVIHADHKVTMLADISSLEDRLGKAYSNDEDWPGVENMLAELRKIVEEAPEEGEEGELYFRKLPSLVIKMS